jgi:HAD superfamily hydrolase (TIGR01490 family)
VSGTAAAAGTAAAFFDLDRTLMAGSSAFQFGRASYAAGMVSRRQLARDAVDNVRFRLSGSTDEATEALRERIYTSIAGRRVLEMQRLMPQVLAGVLPRIYPEMLATAYGHQDAGRRAYIVTAASQELAEQLAAVLAFDGAIGARSEVVDGVYTGRPEGPFTYREGKAEAIRELAAAEGIDLAASYAYSDSASDLPMLRVVGHAVVVNPDGELTRIARTEGWDVVRLEPLGRRLRVAAAVAAFAVPVGAGRAVQRRRRPSGAGGTAGGGAPGRD